MGEVLGGQGLGGGCLAFGDRLEQGGVFPDVLAEIREPLDHQAPDPGGEIVVADQHVLQVRIAGGCVDQAMDGHVLGQEGLGVVRGDVQSPDVPGLGPHTRFERPPLLATLRMKHGQPVAFITAHLKSKRPKFLQDAQGQPLEDRDDHKVAAIASLRSLLMRGAEAAALRCIVIDLLRGSGTPLVVLGDFNDNPTSVTTQLVAATSEVAYDKGARDVALFNAFDLQGEAALKRNVAYSHIHQGFPDVLDQVLVSEEFVPGSRFNVGDVRRVDYFNDHLHEGRDRSRSDHGFVRALLRLRTG